MKDKKRTYSIFADIVSDTIMSYHQSCRLLFSEIAALSKQKGYCYANNQYFAQTFEVSISSVSKGYISLRKKDMLMLNISEEEVMSNAERFILIWNSAMDTDI